MSVNLNVVPIVVVSNELYIEIRELITAYYTKVTPYAIKIFGRKVYLLNSANHNPLYSIDLDTSVAEALDEKSNRSVDFPELFKRWGHNAGHEYFMDLLRKERARFPDLI